VVEFVNAKRVYVYSKPYRDTGRPSSFEIFLSNMAIKYTSKIYS